MAFRLDSYLDRIGLADVPAGAEGLVALQQAHMRSIPFENIDPLLGIVPSLAMADLVDKLVSRGRGGYCYEHNALFGAALGAFGFEAQPVLARVRNGSSRGGARSHQAFVVAAEGETWLCDTGFGGHGSLHPLRLGSPDPQSAPNGTYRVRRDDALGESVLERLADETWVSLYGFDGAPVQEIDFEAANFLCARWDGAPFSTNLMVAFHAAGGRVGLFNRALTLGQPPDTQARLLSSASELGAVLRDDCGLVLADGAIEAIWAKIEHAPTRR